MDSQETIFELNIDGLVGPNHNYGGLSRGNIASFKNALTISNPQGAAKQGLEKMRLLHRLGIKQAIFPPHQRPNLLLLHQMGFTGTPEQQIEKAYQTAPELLIACYSASSMWAANAATVSSSLDTADRKVHFTAANLVSNLHRHQEADFSSYLLKQIFSDPNYFQHHQVLPKSTVTSDEGAANHIRLSEHYSSAAINLFIYGKQGIYSNQALKSPSAPLLYPARQTLEASEAIARAHQLDPKQAFFICQNPKVIDDGVFHNDVIAMSNESTLILHEEAFVDQKTILKTLQENAQFQLQCIEIKNEQLSVAEAVETYLFNSQLITVCSEDASSKKMALIAPAECENTPRTKLLIEELIDDSSNPISSVHYLNLMQSMRNGGGPACLRLRVPLTKTELENMQQSVLVNDEILDTLEGWIDRHYRTELQINDLRDPLFINECLSALDELTYLLKLGSIYPFQTD